jgi:hypothetical protein
MKDIGDRTMLSIAISTTLDGQDPNIFEGEKRAEDLVGLLCT